jgi:uncharacterized protein YdhG (YjbR/CyaY superfamily)
MPQAPKDIANYIAMFPEETKDQLLNMQGIIEKAAPKAEPTISYGMPAFKQEKILVYFAGYRCLPACWLLKQN